MTDIVTNLAGPAAREVADPAFPFLADMARTVPAVTAACAAILPPGAACRQVRLVKHKPGRRCLLRYGYACPGGKETGRESDKETGIFGKAGARRLDAHSHVTQTRLWRSGFGPDSTDGIHVAEPVGTLDHLNMWLQREAAGRPASEILVSGADPAAARRIAAALAKLHRADPGDVLPADRRWTIADEIAMLRRRLAEAADARPALAGDILDVLRLCERAADTLPERADTGVHRDFYADQLLLDGERVTIVDLDLYARGDPAIDAGNFLAHVSELALRRHRDPEALQAFETAFLRRFLELSPHISPEAVEIYAALTLARHVSISIAMPERREATAALVALGRKRLERALDRRHTRLLRHG